MNPPPPHSPLLKIRFFSEPEIYSSFSFLTPSNLLKITKFLVKVSQFEFFVMTEKNRFVSKLFLSLNISDIVYLLCKNCTTPPPPLEKVTPLFPINPPLKIIVLSKPPFLKISFEVQPPLPQQNRGGGGAHYKNAVTISFHVTYV